MTLAASEHESAPERSVKACILVAEDNPDARELMRRRLTRLGHTVATANNGAEALEQISADPPDMVLLDIMMPVLDGYSVLERLRQSGDLSRFPVVVTSAVDDLESIARCVRLGADDYLLKPVDAVLLEARVSASLERKLLRDREHRLMAELELERERSDSLLRNVLPTDVAERLRAGESTIADAYSEATVLFADLVGFSSAASQMSPRKVVQILNELYVGIDGIAAKHGIEKIKTVGDTYMAAGGIPRSVPDHAHRVASFALDVIQSYHGRDANDDFTLHLRVGIATGSVIAGVIGAQRLAYDLWGDTVNLASRMESTGVPGRIQVSARTCELLSDVFELEPRGKVEVKGKGTMPTFFLNGRRRA